MPYLVCVHPDSDASRIDRECLGELPDGHLVKGGHEYFFAHPPQGLFEETAGENEVFDDGCNTFHARPDGPHRYIRPRVSPQELAHGIIEPLMLAQR